MKYKINRLLNKLGWLLVTKTYIVTATEIIIRERVNSFRCEHCGKSPYHLLDKSCCNKD